MQDEIKKKAPGGPVEHRWKKGQSGNPKGRIDPVGKALRNLTLKSYRDVIELALQSDLSALRDLAQNPATPTIQVGVATAIINAVRKGDWTTFEAIVSRIVGKIPDHVQITSLNAHVMVDPADVRAAMKQLDEDV